MAQRTPDDTSVVCLATPTPSASATKLYQPGLFPGTKETSIVRPVVVATRGRTETAARCHGCNSWHRHTGLGMCRALCGITYRVQPRRAIAITATESLGTAE